MKYVRAVVVAVLVVLPALAVSTPARARPDDPARASTSEPREKSRAAFRRGVAQLRAQDWAGARASFEEAWSLFQHPSILLNLGIARLRTGDPVLAERDLVRFLSEDGGAAPDELATAREALAEARSKIGVLRVTVTPASARVLVDGQPLAAHLDGGALVAETRLRAGDHVVKAFADGYGGEQRSVEIASSHDADVKLSLSPKERAPKEPLPDGPDTRAIVGWSCVGLSGAAVVTGAILALRASSLSDDYGDPANADAYQNPDVRSEGIAFRTGADIAFGAAILAGAAAVVLLLTDFGQSKAGSSNRGSVAQRMPSGAIVRW